MEAAALPSSCKLLLQFVLSTLPHCGDNYLPVFKFISSFYKGDPFLSDSGGVADITFLQQQLKTSQVEKKSEDEEATGKGRYRSAVLLGILIVGDWELKCRN